MNTEAGEDTIWDFIADSMVDFAAGMLDSTIFFFGFGLGFWPSQFLGTCGSEVALLSGGSNCGLSIV